MIDDIFKRGGWVRTVLYVLAGLFAVLLIFHAGVVTGERKAAFSYRMGDAYYHAFEGGQRKMLFMRGDFSGAHGAAGKIISVNLPTLIVEGEDNFEKVVVIGEHTEIRRFRDTASTSDLVPGEFVVAIGEPNDEAQIAARFIRILPPPPEGL